MRNKLVVPPSAWRCALCLFFAVLNSPALSWELVTFKDPLDASKFHVQARADAKEPFIQLGRKIHPTLTVACNDTFGDFMGIIFPTRVSFGETHLVRWRIDKFPIKERIAQYLADGQMLYLDTGKNSPTRIEMMSGNLLKVDATFTSIGSTIMDFPIKGAAAATAKIVCKKW